MVLALPLLQSCQTRNIRRSRWMPSNSGLRNAKSKYHGQIRIEMFCTGANDWADLPSDRLSWRQWWDWMNVIDFSLWFVWIIIMRHDLTWWWSTVSHRPCHRALQSTYDTRKRRNWYHAYSRLSLTSVVSGTYILNKYLIGDFAFLHPINKKATIHQQPQPITHSYYSP